MSIDQSSAVRRPASLAQQRLWFEDEFLRQANPDLPGYVSPRAVRLHGPLNLAALVASLETVLSRHEVLRARFVLSDGELWQFADEQAPLNLRPEPIPGATDVDREAALRVELNAALRQPFDLTNGPVTRFRLFALAESEYVLLLIVHHIATDLWSGDLMLTELVESYRATCANAEPSLPELSLQYADYAQWQRDRQDSPAFANDLTYWERQLAGFPGILDLPTDRSRPPVRSFCGGTVPFELPTSTVTAMTALARAEGATRFMVLLAAYQLTLARWIGQPDVVVGCPVPNRTRPETELLIGFFTNLLPLRLVIDERETFRETLGRVRDTMFDAYDHQELSFDQLVRKISPIRTPSYAPLIQATLLYHEGQRSRWEQPFGETVDVDAEDMSLYDLSVSVWDSAEGLYGRIYYSVDLFDEATISRFAERLTDLLKQLTADPDQPLTSVATLGSGERSEIFGWSMGPAPTSTPQHVVDSILASARADGAAVAVSWPGGELSYEDLDRRSASLAGWLVHRGILAGERVGVVLPRGADMLVCMLAIWRARAVYVPLDPTYPANRLAFIAADADLRFVLGHQPTAAVAEALTRTKFVELATVSMHHPIPEAPAGDGPAYVIYTSGSTGLPKGVEVTHATLANLVRAYLDCYGMTSADVSSLMTSPCFDASLWESLPVLSAGGRAAIVPDEIRSDVSQLWGFLAEHAVTVSLMITPLLMAAGNTAPATHPTLRCIQTGGDWLNTVPLGLPCQLSNVYGPTEGTIVSTAGWVRADDEPHIGTPLPGIRVYVLDGWLRPVPAGVKGDLFLAGVGVARGYLKRPGLTAARFLPDVIAADGSRMYRTDDQVRWRPDGCLHFIGRGDRQVTLRGFRIELGEIEFALRKHPAVEDAVVVVCDDTSVGPALVGYYVPTKPVGSSQLRDHLSVRLPQFMVPSIFVTMQSLPLTVNGKLDRDALPPPPIPDAGTEHVGPESGVPGLIAEAWFTALGLSGVANTDDFFALGGHSLMASSVCAEIGKRLGCHIPMVTLFEFPVFEDFAEQVERAAGGTT
ncbi:non-ribosomal peptide synthetase [Nocardia colli]|uniref:non-ribosomal peptide synthetase n=1 Tax=Nocardia colli TaxID=2545717 RepID=UPI0035DDDBAB